jgi:hypothetical protein
MSSSHGKERRELKADAEKQGWEFVEGKRHDTSLCPCPEKHRKLYVPKTPSNPDAWKELGSWLTKHTCWEE